MKDIRRYPFSLWQRILEKYYSTKPSSGQILMFHNVYENQLSSEDDAGISISKSNFEALIEQYAKLPDEYRN